MGRTQRPKMFPSREQNKKPDDDGNDIVHCTTNNVWNNAEWEIVGNELPVSSRSYSIRFIYCRANADREQRAPNDDGADIFGLRLCREQMERKSRLSLH